VGSKAGISCCFEALAAVSVAQDRPDDGATLLGCAAQVAEGVGYRLEAFKQAFHDETVRRLVHGLEESGLACALERGRGMPLDAALAWAAKLTDRFAVDTVRPYAVGDPVAWTI
jgi:hypothetical protein